MSKQPDLENTCSCTRRTVLQALGVVSVGLLAGCGSSGGNEPPPPDVDGGPADDDGGGIDDGGPSPADGGSAVDGGTPSDCSISTNWCLDLNASPFANLRNVNGSVAMRAPNGDRIIVIRTGASSVAALSDICTHQGCNMTFVASSQILNCPCHGAQFGLDGRVRRGPATVPVKVYTATLEGTTVVIALQ
jgi:cytochrome b6-f complex iron-sulfur subunit